MFWGDSVTPSPDSMIKQAACKGWTQGSLPYQEVCATELQELGYSVVAYPCGSVFAAVKAFQRWAQHLKDTSGYLDHMLSFDEYFEFIGASAIREREKQFFAVKQ